MTDATLLSDRGRHAVRLERHLADPPAVVWRALTEREQLRSWFPCDVIVEGGRWEVGAAITFPFSPEALDLTLTGDVLEVDEPNILAFTWGEDTLRFELSPEAGGTSTSCRRTRQPATPPVGRTASTVLPASTLPATHGGRVSSGTPPRSNPPSARRDESRFEPHGAHGSRTGATAVAATLGLDAANRPRSCDDEKERDK